VNPPHSRFNNQSSFHQSCAPDWVYGPVGQELSCLTIAAPAPQNAETENPSEWWADQGGMTPTSTLTLAKRLLGLPPQKQGGGVAPLGAMPVQQLVRLRIAIGETRCQRRTAAQKPPRSRPPHNGRTTRHQQSGPAIPCSIAPVAASTQTCRPPTGEKALAAVLRSVCRHQKAKALPSGDSPKTHPPTAHGSSAKTTKPRNR